MTLAKRDSFMPFFDDFLSRDWFNWTNNHFSTTNTTLPAVNIRESADHFLVEMAAPGLEKKDFEIELKDNLLTISCQHQDQRELKEGDRYTRREFSYQSFQRSFQLEKDVAEVDKIKATYQDGMLRLTIPKTESAKSKAPKKIRVN